MTALKYRQSYACLGSRGKATGKAGSQAVWKRVSLLKAFSYVKKIYISCRLMLLVAVTSKEKSPGVSDSA